MSNEYEEYLRTVSASKPTPQNNEAVNTAPQSHSLPEANQDASSLTFADADSTGTSQPAQPQTLNFDFDDSPDDDPAITNSNDGLNLNFSSTEIADDEPTLSLNIDESAAPANEDHADPLPSLSATDEVELGDEEELELAECKWSEVKKGSYVVVTDKMGEYLTEGVVKKRSGFSGALTNGKKYKPTKVDFYHSQPDDAAQPEPTPEPEPEPQQPVVEKSKPKKTKSKAAPQPLEAEVYPPVKKPSVIGRLVKGTLMTWAVVASTGSAYSIWLSLGTNQSPQANVIEQVREQVARNSLAVTTLTEQADYYATADDVNNAKESISNIQISLNGFQRNQNMQREQISQLDSNITSNNAKLTAVLDDTKNLSVRISEVKNTADKINSNSRKQDQTIASLVKGLKEAKTASVNPPQPEPVRYSNRAAQQPSTSASNRSDSTDRFPVKPAAKLESDDIRASLVRRIGNFSLASIDIWGGHFEATLEHDMMFRHLREGDYIDEYQVHSINQRNVLLQNINNSKFVPLIK